MKFTEDKLEQTITELLHQEGYDPINRETLDRKGSHWECIDE
jgi:hypothetical protein